MVNKVTLIGNLGADPEVRRLESGVAVAKLNVATNETYTDKAGVKQTLTEWHNIVLWRGLAEVAEKWYKKGMLIYVEGKITHRKYTTQEGQERYITEIVASSSRNLSRSEGGGGQNRGGFPTEADAPQKVNANANAPATAAADPMPPAADTVAEEGGDLPF